MENERRVYLTTMERILTGSKAAQNYCSKIEAIDEDYFVREDFESKYDCSDNLVVSKELFDELSKFTINGELTREALTIIYIASAIRRRLTPSQPQKWNKTMNIIKLLSSNNMFLASIPYDNYGDYEKLYQLVVDYTISKHGDTVTMKNINNSEFFEDYVPRVIDHDKLHDFVAKHLRGVNAVEIFTELKSDSNIVELDKTKFDTMWKNNPDRIKQLIFEEIVVLILERYYLVIYAVSRNVVKIELCDVVEFLDRFLFQQFITNLCGNKDEFLRRFCIHYYEELYHYIILNLPKITTIDIDKIDKELKTDCGSTISTIGNVLFNTTEAVVCNDIRWKPFLVEGISKRILDSDTSSHINYNNTTPRKYSNKLVLLDNNIYLILDSNNNVVQSGTITITKNNRGLIFNIREFNELYSQRNVDIEAIKCGHIVIYSSDRHCPWHGVYSDVTLSVDYKINPNACVIFDNINELLKDTILSHLHELEIRNITDNERLDDYELTTKIVSEYCNDIPTSCDLSFKPVIMQTSTPSESEYESDEISPDGFFNGPLINLLHTEMARYFNYIQYLLRDE